MKRIIIILTALVFTIGVYGQSIKYAQLERCIVAGDPCDSCFRMTSPTGYLTKCLHISALKSIIGGGGSITANVDGTYTYSTGNVTFGYECNVINDTTIEIRNHQGSLASTCAITGLYSVIKKVYISEDTVMVFETFDSTVFSIDLCPVVRSCETVTSLTYNASTNNLSWINETGVLQTINLNESTITSQANGSYKFKNQANDSLFFGYKFNCIDDSTIAITAWDGTPVDTCVLKGAAFADSSEITCLDNGYYEFMRSDGSKDTFGYKFNQDSVGTTGYLYLVNHCGFRSDSFLLPDPGGYPLDSIDLVNDTFASTNCYQYIGNVTLNDTLCTEGYSIFSFVEGSALGGTVVVDAEGNFIYTFTDCDALSTHSFSVMGCCPDGTCDFSEVLITLPACGSATANIDQYTGPRANSIVVSVGPNDVACSAPKVTTYTIQQQPSQGSLYFNSNGTGIYAPFPGFTGSDSAIVQLRCDGVICDTSWLKFRIYSSNVFDDLYSVVNGQTISGLNATSNDVACTPPAVTTYGWNGALFPANAGTVTGALPSSFSFAADSNFCGVAMRQYDQFCDAVLSNTATVYFYVSCGNAIDDVYDFFDSTGTIRPYNNDNVCTNGGVSTWHLATNPTTSGTGLTVQLYTCYGDGCPTATPVSGAYITSWDTLTGIGAFKVPEGYSGNVCFKYFLKCKSGGTQNVDTACVKIIRIIDPNLQFVITHPDSFTPTLIYKMGAYCEGSAGFKRQLNNGDKLRLSMVTLQGNVQVDLIVGQDIKTGAGYTNDVSGRWASWCVPAIPQPTVVLNRASLFNNSVQFSFLKDIFSKNSNNWGDGLVGGAKKGQAIQVSLRLLSGSCGTETDSITQTMPKFFDHLTFVNSCGNVFSGSGFPPCPGVPVGNNSGGYVNLYVSWGQFCARMGVDTGAVANIFTGHKYKCAITDAYSSTVQFRTNFYSNTTTGGYRLFQSCANQCSYPISADPDTITHYCLVNPITVLQNNIDMSVDTLWTQMLDIIQIGQNVHDFMSATGGLPYTVYGGNLNIQKGEIPMYVWTLNKFTGQNPDSVRVYYSTTHNGVPTSQASFMYQKPGYQPNGFNAPAAPPYPTVTNLSNNEGKYRRWAIIYDDPTNGGNVYNPYPYTKNYTIKFSY